MATTTVGESTNRAANRTMYWGIALAIIIVLAIAYAITPRRDASMTTYPSPVSRDLGAPTEVPNPATPAMNNTNMGAVQPSDESAPIETQPMDTQPMDSAPTIDPALPRDPAPGTEPGAVPDRTQ